MTDSSSNSPLTPAGYFRWFLIAAASGLALIFAFTAIIDPLGISPLRIPIPGLNLHKPLRTNFDRLVKPYDISRGAPRTLFIGSSLTKQSIDPALLDGSPLAPAYNAGIDGSANLGENKRLLEYYLFADRNTRTVYIELFLTAILQFRNAVPSAPLDSSEFRNERIQALISGSALQYSLETIRANRVAQEPPKLPFSRGFAPVTPPPNRFSVDNLPDFLYRGRIIDPPLKAPAAPIVAAREMIELCRRYKVDCRFFISPLHADVLYGIYFAGLWDELVVLKKAFAQIAPTYDFTRYNDLIDERSGPIEYWWEGFHFSPALGANMVRVMTGERPANLPANFGILLTADNVDAETLAWAAERDKWISRYPLVRYRFEAAQNNNLKAPNYNGSLHAEDREILVGATTYKIVSRGAGVVEYVGSSPSFVLGWAGDIADRKAARAMVIFQGKQLVAYAEPNIPRPDISTESTNPLSFGGFYTVISRITGGTSAPALRAFSLYDDGTAAELNYTPGAKGFLKPDSP